jgi:alanine racemase
MTRDSSALRAVSPSTATPAPRVLRPQRAHPSSVVRPTRADINLAHLRHNLRVLRRAAQGAQIWSVLKADGYGHGSKAVARTLERAGVDGVCVALLEEGIELRDAGICVPILVMGGYYGRALDELLRYRLIPVLQVPEQVEALAEEVRYGGFPGVEVHLKVDTGMGRLGALPADVERIGAALSGHPQVRLTGLMTHFACADCEGRTGIDEQLDLFDRVTAQLEALGFRPRMRHAANSAALLRSARARLDMVRPGIALFGVEPVAGLAAALRPVMQIRTQIVSIRELMPGQSTGYGSTWTAQRVSRIATIPMGYADGLSRALSNRGHVLVRGRQAPIAGVVSMDMAMIDVTEIEGATVSDECVVLGRQKGPLGDACIGAAQIAAELGTIPWEVLTSVSRRVPRFYREPC